MNLIRFALRKPVTVMVLVAALLFFGISAVRSVKIDIFPKLDLPVIYLTHPYGGFTPDQMEAYFGKQYVNIMLFVNGIQRIETKNIQGLTLMKISFYPGTNMAQAAAELTAAANRASSNFPPGSQPPFLIRFDASTLPVGQLVLRSATRSGNELIDLANTYVRSAFTSIPGIVAAPPFGGSSRTIVIRPDPELMRIHNLSVDQLVGALRDNNQATPSGNLRLGDINYLTPTNTTINNVSEFGDIPLQRGGVQTLYMRDVARVEDAGDVTTSYALVNGKRSVYLNIAKSADASTWEVVQKLKAALPKFQAQLPEDVKLSFEFDQSTYVINSLRSLLVEGIIGAVLTGVMVLLFLGDPRGAGIVILTIPVSIISGVLFLWLFGQTINIMTLSGLSLAIGILVDESTVTIENIHQHLDLGKTKAEAIWDACREIAFPKLLILFCILAVFAPAFTMTGIPHSLFLPLALAIGFSMIVSYLLAQTFVPVFANWVMKEHRRGERPSGVSRFDRLRSRFLRFQDRMMPSRGIVSLAYLVLASAAAWLLLAGIGRDVLPKVNGSQFQLRLRAPDGTRLERTEEKTIAALAEIRRIAGAQNISITSAFVGQHPQQFSVSPIYLFMAGPQEAVLQVALREGWLHDLDALKDSIRAHLARVIPDVRLSFEPIELTEKILSQGSPTPIEVRVSGRNKQVNEQYASRLVERLKRILYMRDAQIAQAIHYPAIDVDIDRVRAAQLGVSMADISRSLTATTSSSRFTEKNIWIDRRIGQAYSVQVAVPENQLQSESDLAEVPVQPNSSRPALGDIARISQKTVYGENDNLGVMPFLSVTASLHKQNLGTAVRDAKNAIASLGPLPRGLSVELVGLSETLDDTLSSLQTGLLVAVVVIFLMLAANFQSFRVSLVVLSTVPAVIVGSVLLLLATGATLNLQSYMGIIMAVGVSISNSVLLITNAEHLRLKHGDALKAAREAASLRMRPILMTALAMVVGMIPMASGIGEGGDQSSPLGRAVIGGLIASTLAAIFVLPLVFGWAMNKRSIRSISLDPSDTESRFYLPGANAGHPIA